MRTARMLAAGTCSRLQPASAGSPKGLTEGNERMIPERLIGAWLALLAVAISGCDSVSGGSNAVALLRVHRSPPDLIPSLSTVGDNDRKEEYETFKTTQIELIMSPYVLSAALRRPRVSQLPAIKSQDKPIDFLTKQIHVSFPGGSEVMRVSLYCGDDEQSVVILDAVVESYLEVIAQSEREDRTRRLETLRAQYREDVREVQEKSTIVHKLSEELGVSATGKHGYLASMARHETEMLASHRAEIRQQWSNATLEFALAEASTVEEDSATTIAARKVELLTQLLEKVNQEYEESKASTASVQVPGFSSDLATRQIELDSLKASVAEIASVIRRLELNLKKPPRITLLQPAMVATSGRE